MCADGRQRLGAEHDQAHDDDAAADDAMQSGALAQHHRREYQAGQGGTGRLDGGSVAERHQNESGVGDQRLRRPGEHRQGQPAAPADAAERDDPGAQSQRRQQQSGPEETVKGEFSG